MPTAHSCFAGLEIHWVRHSVIFSTSLGAAAPWWKLSRGVAHHCACACTGASNAIAVSFCTHTERERHTLAAFHRCLSLPSLPQLDQPRSLSPFHLLNELTIRIITVASTISSIILTCIPAIFLAADLGTLRAHVILLSRATIQHQFSLCFSHRVATRLIAWLSPTRCWAAICIPLQSTAGGHNTTHSRPQPDGSALSHPRFRSYSCSGTRSRKLFSSKSSSDDGFIQ